MSESGDEEGVHNRPEKHQRIQQVKRLHRHPVEELLPNVRPCRNLVRLQWKRETGS
jgi:hypothetical protein